MSSPADRLRSRIRSSGPIPFAAFMEEALYGEGGYYRRDSLPIGEAGDFVTGSSFSPLFGRTTARLVQRLDVALGDVGRPADFFEAGFGSGIHLAHVAAALSRERVLSPLSRRMGGDGRGAGGEGPCADDENRIPRRLLAWDRISRAVPEGVTRIDDLSEIDEKSIEGMIFSYELFDALPVHRVIGRPEGETGEVWVDLGADGGFAWREGDLSDPALADLLGEEKLKPGQIADLAPQWAPLYGELARRLKRGLLVTCDYGYERRLLLDARLRRHGTLACHSRQRLHRNPFVLVGEQDLTAHVDFTALERAGEAAGLTTIALTRQGLWLAAAGIFQEIADAGPETRQEAIALLGEGMGEEIRVLVQARDVNTDGLFDVPLLDQKLQDRLIPRKIGLSAPG